MTEDQPASEGAVGEGFEHFVAREWADLVRFTTLLTGDLGHAEDLVQTSLIRLGAHWAKARRSPEAYVRTILLNLARNRWRDRSRHKESPLPADVAQLRATSPAVSDESMVIANALSSLSPRQRQIVVLHYYVDVSVEDIARILRLSTGTVKSTLSDGRRALHRKLEGLMEVVTNG